MRRWPLDDPEIFRHPILYLSEPGYWSASDSELRHLRAPKPAFGLVAAGPARLLFERSFKSGM